MLSKQQAKAASEALLESSRHERDKRSPLLLRYPELRALAFSERKRVLELARRNTWRRWPILLPAGGILVLAVFWVYALITRMEVAESIWWVPLLGAILLRQIVERRLRHELRQLIESIQASPR